ncbi:hypothetical protein [Variovorax paradoxus]|uniref:hypothetical protein n=1 Tax=Variovorax paradoxus TaxID=34073 RepID=UPI003D65A8C3
MPTPILYVYMGARRLQAAWARRRGAELRMLFDVSYSLPAEATAEATGAVGALPAGVADSMRALGRACQAETLLTRGIEMRVVVSDVWAPSASVPWNAAQYKLSAAQAAARVEIRDSGHDVSSVDLLRLDDAPLREPRLAVCYPKMLLDLIRHLASELGTQPRSVSTLSALAWRGCDAPTPVQAQAERVLVILEPGDVFPRQVILLRGQRASACIDEVVIRPLHSGANGRTSSQETAAAVAAIVQRLGWSAVPSASAPEVTTLFSLTDLTMSDPLTSATGPMAWWVAPPGRRDAPAVHALDAVARSARPSGLKSLLAVGVLASIGFLSQVLWRDMTRLQDAQRAVAAARRDTVVQPVRPPSAAQARRIASVNAVVSELNIPLPRLFRALQAPKDIRVGLLGLEIVAGRERGLAAEDAALPSRPTLKVHAEAPTSTDMTRYVAYLSGRKPLDHAYLVRHELAGNAVAAANNSPAYRFTVEVAWKD